MKQIFLFIFLSISSTGMAMNLADSTTEIEPDYATDVIKQYFDNPDFHQKLEKVFSDEKNHTNPAVIQIRMFMKNIVNILAISNARGRDATSALNDAIDGSELRALVEYIDNNF